MNKRELASIFLAILGETANCDGWTTEDWQKLLPHLQRHHVAAWAYSRFKSHIPAELHPHFLLAFAHNEFQNAMLLNECKKIELAMSSVRLKGMAMLDDIYDTYGQRNCCDIDLLSTDDSIGDFCDLEKRMRKYDFETYIQPRWIGADNRYAFVKKNGAIEISVDWHFKPFWSADPGLAWRFRNLHTGGRALDLADQFFHLAVNWGYQDNFVSLSKLIDLKLFWSKYSAQWDWTRLHELIQIHNFHRVFVLVGYALEQVGIIDTSGLMVRLPRANTIAAKIFDAEFLFAPDQTSWKYFYIKNYTKSNFREAMHYNLSWLKSVIAPQFTVRLSSR